MAVLVENPDAWTPLHHEIDAMLVTAMLEASAPAEMADALMYDRALHKAICIKLGLEVFTGADQVRSAIAEHQKDVQDGVCGPSLAAFLINRFNTRIKG